MSINIAETDKQIQLCYDVMQKLGPHIIKTEFITRIQYQQEDDYRLAFLADGYSIVALTGFRLYKNIAWGNVRTNNYWRWSAPLTASVLMTPTAIKR